MLARVMLALFLFISSAPTFGADPEGQYLFDLLKQQHYLAVWKAMLKGETVPAWVKNYASTFDGPSNPSTAVPLVTRSIRSAMFAKRITAAAMSSPCCSRPSERKPGASSLPARIGSGSGIPTQRSKRRS